MSYLEPPVKRILTAFFIALTLPGVTAANTQSSQLVLQVQQGISHYGIHADLSNLNLTALAQLKGILGRKGSYLNKRDSIRFILRKNGYDL